MKLDLEEIKNNRFNFSYLNKLAKNIRNFIYEKVQEHGGHLSSNLGVVEFTIALACNFDFLKNKIIFDTGHQTYVYKILCGEAHQFSSLRKVGGMSGFQEKDGIYHHFSAGHAGTALSFALGLTYNEDDNYIICVIGDGSLSNGTTLEAINNLHLYLNKKILIIFNNNKMSISPSQGFISNDFFLSDAFKNYCLQKQILHLGDVDGHSFEKLNDAFEKFKENNKLTILTINTVKGKGYENIENDKKGEYHSFYRKQNVYENTFTWTQCITNELKKYEQKIMVLTAGMSLGNNLDTFISEKVIDVQIAESHLLMLAAGISENKKLLPCVFIYSTFLQRAFDQLIHDIARVQYKVLFFINRSGFVGEDGETHHGFYDLYLLLSLNLKVIQLSNMNDVPFLLEEAVKTKKPLFIRFSRNIAKLIDKNIYLKKIDGANIYLNPINEVDVLIISYGDHISNLINKFKNLNNISILDMYDFGFTFEKFNNFENKKLIFVEDSPLNFSFYKFFLNKIIEKKINCEILFYNNNLPNYVPHGSSENFYLNFYENLTEILN